MLLSLRLSTGAVVCSTARRARFYFRLCGRIAFRTASTSTSAAEKYQKISAIEHVLLRPDSYIGSVLLTDQQSAFFYDSSRRKMAKKECRFVPGLLKVFDEILVNAADNKKRDPSMTTIRVDIDREEGSITVFNDGRGIPVEIHPVENLYVPSLIFGSLYTSSNYDDSEVKFVGGRNGFGAKLCNIFSKEFTVETSYAENRRSFMQTWRNNMNEASNPQVREIASDARDFTRVKFKPDLAKFHLKSLDDTTIGLMHKRVIDVAGTLTNVHVFFNGEKIQISSFRDYVQLYCADDLSSDELSADVVDESLAASACVFLEGNPLWEVAVARSDSAFQQISFVNNIATPKGGRHVDYIVKQLTSRLRDELTKRLHSEKRNLSAQIRQRLSVFVNALIENPSFDSQAKEYLTTPPRQFGSRCVLSEDFFKELMHSTDIVEYLVRDVNRRDNEMVLEKHTKKRSLTDLHKLEDARDAGTSNGHLCTLIVTEGDSAKALAVAGLAVLGRDKYGVFPLRGKLANVRGFNEKNALANEEISALVRILGLQFGAKYDNSEMLKKLRYGHVMLMTDQDADGSHIKGLVINFLHSFWPSLIQNDFVQGFITPLLKAKRGSEVIAFYSNADFEKWRQQRSDSAKFSVKYYKGLGTSSAQEAREYFSNLEKHRVQFVYVGDGDDSAIELAFDKTKADQRKQWITGHIAGGSEEVDDRNVGELSYGKFIDEELIVYSELDLKRSLPSAIDGLKPSQRKVLHAMFERFERTEIKVNQLAGAVAQHCGYHHGEISLVNTIVRLAQDFVGSNNINVLQPIGQFGTRLAGGSDAASARYIYTALSPLARFIFPRADDRILSSVKEDNAILEPEWFCPVIPLVLVNGAEGIGTGWATRVLPHNPVDVIANVRRMIDGQHVEKMIPYYRDFTGTVREVSPNRYELTGIAKPLELRRKNSPFFEVEISELPAGVWTQTYKENVLEKLHSTDVVEDYEEHHSESAVRFVVKISRTSRRDKQLRTGTDAMEKLRKLFRLNSIVSSTSMVLFDARNSLRCFNSAEEIFDEFFKTRRQKYEERLLSEVATTRQRAEFLDNQYRFVDEKVKGNIVLEGRTRNDIEETLKRFEFRSNPLRAHKDKEQNWDFGYLLDLPLRQLSSDEARVLCEKRDVKRAELEELLRLSWKELWLRDLDALESAFHAEEKKRKR